MKLQAHFAAVEHYSGKGRADWSCKTVAEHWLCVWVNQSKPLRFQKYGSILAAQLTEKLKTPRPHANHNPDVPIPKTF